MIVPALLTDKRQDLKEMLDLCATFTNYVQIDIMDGEFVPSKSISQEDLRGLNTSLNTEAHLMVQKPLEWLDAFKKLGSQSMLFHFEINEDHAAIIEEIKGCGLKAGIAINPQTELKDIEHLVERIDSVLFMSVNPGFYGAPFIPQVLTKIKEFKKAFPKTISGIDGGVKLSNLKQVLDSGVDYVCVGSAILKSANPKEAFLSFQKTHG